MSNKIETIEQVQALFSASLLPAAILDANKAAWCNPAARILLDNSQVLTQLLGYISRLTKKNGDRQAARTLHLAGAPEYLFTITPLAESGLFLALASLDTSSSQLTLAAQKSNEQLDQLVRELFATVMNLKNLSLLYEDDTGYAAIKKLNRDCYQLMKLGQNTRWYTKLLTQKAPALQSLDLAYHLRVLTSALATKMLLLPQVKLATEIEDAPTEILGSTELVDAIVTNLIDNSIKSGFLEQLLEIRLTLRTYGKNAVITIIDNGSGLPAEFSEKVFEPFFTLDESHRSTGLGLTVVKLAAEQMGGSVLASFKDGEGSTISVTLPLDQRTILSTSSPSSAIPDYFDRYSLIHIMLSDVVDPPMP